MDNQTRQSNVTVGLRIDVEGPDGVGKTTLVRALFERARSQDQASVRYTFPTEVARRHAAEWIQPDRHALAALFAADMLARRREIQSFVRQRYSVLCDRGALSTYAYQGQGDSAFEAWLDGLYAPLPKADLTLVLEAPWAVRRARMIQRGALDDMDQASIGLGNHYARLAATWPGAVLVDASGTVEDTMEAAWPHVARVLGVSP